MKADGKNKKASVRQAKGISGFAKAEIQEKVIFAVITFSPDEQAFHLQSADQHLSVCSRYTTYRRLLLLKQYKC